LDFKKIQSLNRRSNEFPDEDFLEQLQERINLIETSERLDHSFDFSEVFVLVKRSVKSSLGRRRVGLMLGLADLPDYIGAFHQMGSNFIVMNRSLLDQVTRLAKDRRYLNAYVFYTLLHEYLHTLGYVDEGEVRRLTRQITAQVLGPDHPATRLAVEGPAAVFPELQFTHHALVRSRKLPRFEIVREFEREYRSYVA
jgi:hypothetical protein